MNSQKTYNEIRRLSRPDMVNLGLEQIRSHLDFASANQLIFDKISVWANNESVKIEFTNPIKFIPLNSEYFYDVTIDIVGQSLSYDLHANPSDYNGGPDTPFFVPTMESERIIQFVIDAINQAAGLPKGESKEGFLKDFEGSLIIRDQENDYSISRISTWQESWYKIDKQTGEISDGGHAHLEPAPIDEDENSRFIEITE